MKGVVSRSFCGHVLALFCFASAANKTAHGTPSQALPETSLEEIRLIGPRLMLNATTTLGAVFRRCNAVLSGGLEGVDAMGEKVNAVLEGVAVVSQQ